MSSKDAKQFGCKNLVVRFCIASDIYAIMSDMSSERITVRIPEELGGRLRHRSRSNGQTESDLVRDALENYLGRSSAELSAFELAQEAGLIGCVPRGRRGPPKDLSTNPRHFKGFGKNK
jgi:predicted DNA-binding protein